MRAHGLPFALLAISDRRSLGALSLIDWLTAVAESGVGAVQLREKDLGDRARWLLARTARERLGRTLLLVNGRVDLALAAGGDGVHLPADEIPIAAVRQAAGRKVWVGRSTHTVEEVEHAARDGADYVVFGPVFSTPSKPGAPAVGLEGLARACAWQVPVLALGGVGGEQVETVAAAGARGIAGIRAFQDLAGLPSLVSRSREVFGKS